MPTILNTQEEIDKTVPIDTSGDSMDVEIENKKRQETTENEMNAEMGVSQLPAACAGQRSGKEYIPLLHGQTRVLGRSPGVTWDRLRLQTQGESNQHYHWRVPCSVPRNVPSNVTVVA